MEYGGIINNFLPINSKGKSKIFQMGKWLENWVDNLNFSTYYQTIRYLGTGWDNAKVILISPTISLWYTHWDHGWIILHNLHIFSVGKWLVIFFLSPHILSIFSLGKLLFASCVYIYIWNHNGFSEVTELWIAIMIGKSDWMIH